ncbi:N-acetylmuramoyl-L-alanine amidase [Fructilactobacillus cliffordii]|uniref:N-acetylmuramoyl-L-alanine amidase n=1 Tax=Fructilactobacillus cliffordii TaxID=2940299 RepID=A0A9Q9E0X1_9LACO|nr:N-acetylmuramoyl-L-alanine amidase [Fructilactobacillus cliffordii]USS89586.1 N-acetylmuramoyl-L-alanine amidase [Fructilactobacillus cliffordii]
MHFKIRNRRGFWVTILVILGTGLVIGTMLLRNNVAVPLNQLAIKAAPTPTSQTIGTVNRGDRVQIITKKRQWAQVVYQQQKIGWVPNWLLNKHSQVKTASKLAETTIVLDPGHGGHDSGALANSNQPEKKYTLKLAQQVASNLQKSGTNVIMTRTKDHTVGLKQRPRLAAAQQANLFVSFHFDSAATPNSGTGFTTYYYHPGASKQLAQSINNQLGHLGLENKGVKTGDYLVIRDNSVPAVLLEMGYMNNDLDFKRIKNPNYRKQAAAEITAGIKEYVNDHY